MNLAALHDQLAQASLDWHDAIRKVVGPVPDEELPAVIAECRRLSEPTESRNFPMPEWGLIAHLIESEYGSRVMFKRAAEYMERTGAKVYCVQCGGECTAEHLAVQATDFNAKKDV